MLTTIDDFCLDLDLERCDVTAATRALWVTALPCWIPGRFLLALSKAQPAVLDDAGQLGAVDSQLSGGVVRHIE